MDLVLPDLGRIGVAAQAMRAARLHLALRVRLMALVAIELHGRLVVEPDLFGLLDGRLLGLEASYDKTLWLKDKYAVPVRGPLSSTEFISWAEILLNITSLLEENSALRAEIKAKQEKIEEISMTDDLTGLYNIRFLNQSIDIEIERSHRFRSIFSLIFMDIDDLKKVNDRFGHRTGSRVLIETARILRENLRKVDIIIRYGGDEFVIIMPQTSKESGFMVADRLRRTIEESVFLKSEDHPVRITPGDV